MVVGHDVALAVEHEAGAGGAARAGRRARPRSGRCWAAAPAPPRRPSRCRPPAARRSACARRRGRCRWCRGRAASSSWSAPPARPPRMPTTRARQATAGQTHSGILRETVVGPAYVGRGWGPGPNQGWPGCWPGLLAGRDPGSGTARSGPRARGRRPAAAGTGPAARRTASRCGGGPSSIPSGAQRRRRADRRAAVGRRPAPGCTAAGSASGSGSVGRQPARGWVGSSSCARGSDGSVTCSSGVCSSGLCSSLTEQSSPGSPRGARPGASGRVRPVHGRRGRHR